MPKPEFTCKPTVYVIDVAAKPERVWEALTSVEFTRQYFFGRSVESNWKVGSPFILRMEDGSVDVEGKVVACDPPRLLTVTWRVDRIVESRKLPDTLVTFLLEPAGKAVRLTMTESHQKPANRKLQKAGMEGGRRGWPMILSSLKSVLETGKPLVL
ncbi:MAG: ATPase [Dehalococcoidia bacterium]|nr:ATPase [Dehalococcoidia bacterium]